MTWISELNFTLFFNSMKPAKTMKALKLYLETSSWNFYYADDAPEKKAITRDFFDALPDNHYDIYISEIVLKEINKASENKAEQLKSLIKQCQPTTLQLELTVADLANAYIEAKALPPKALYDAQHIAFATGVLNLKRFCGLFFTPFLFRLEIRFFEKIGFL